LLSRILEQNCYSFIVATIIINVQVEQSQASRNVFVGSKSTRGHQKLIFGCAKFACDALSMPNANESSVTLEVPGFWVQLPDCNKALGLVVVVGRNGSRCGCDEQRRGALWDHADNAFSDTASALPSLMLHSPPARGVSGGVVRAPNRVRDEPSHFATPAAFW
jgi:hypothetical protein